MLVTVGGGTFTVTLAVEVVVVLETGVGKFRHSQPLEIALLGMPLRNAGLPRFSSNASSLGDSASTAAVPRRCLDPGGFPGRNRIDVEGVPVVEVTVDVATLSTHQRQSRLSEFEVQT